MITRELKLKPTRKQETLLSMQLFQCAGLYNTIIRRIKLSSNDKIYFSKYDLFKQFSGHSKKTDLDSRTIQAVIEQAHGAWVRCFAKKSREPKLKSARNKMLSIPFLGPFYGTRFKGKNRVNLPILGSTRFHKQVLPIGNIKQYRIIKRASGWYLALTIDSSHTFEVEDTGSKVGIDTGFKDIAILSNGKKYTNERFLIRSQKRLAQAQRGNRKHLVARINERVKNRRKDHNHKIAKDIVKKHSVIYITKDNIRSQAKLFGKSVCDAGISQLRKFIIYKSENHGRICKLVSSKNTTLTCSNCGALTGPSGLDGLGVRYWVCACGANHDRDVNSAVNILNIGLGASHVRT